MINSNENEHSVKCELIESETFSTETRSEEESEAGHACEQLELQVHSMETVVIVSVESPHSINSSAEETNNIIIDSITHDTGSGQTTINSNETLNTPNLIGSAAIQSCIQVNVSSNSSIGDSNESSQSSYFDNSSFTNMPVATEITATTMGLHSADEVVVACSNIDDPKQTNSANNQRHINEGCSPYKYFEVSSYTALKEFLESHYEETGTKFCTMSVSKNFGAPAEECDLNGHSVVWRDMYFKKDDAIRAYVDVDYEDGVPRFMVGSVQYQCHFGKDKYIAFKERRRSKIQKLKEEGVMKSRTRKINPSKKLGCPAKISVRQVIRFPEFKITKFTKSTKSEASRKLRSKLLNDVKSVQMEMVFVGYLPKSSEHQFHEVAQDFSKEPVHMDLQRMTAALCIEKVPVAEIVTKLQNHVINEMFRGKTPPDKWRRKYFPKSKTLSNIRRRFVQLCGFTEDQEEKIVSILEKLKEKQPRNNVHFALDIQPEKMGNEESIASSSEDEFFEPDATIEPKSKKKKISQTPELQVLFRPYLICYQSTQQIRLLQRYNLSTCYLVECPNKCSRPIPFFLYFVMVQTNVDYQVVAMILSSKLKKDGLADGLTTLKEWNCFWKPKYWLLGYNDTTINAIESVFPDSESYFLPHTCEQLWSDFLTKPSNELQEHIGEVQYYLRMMLHSYTEESLTAAAACFEESPVWRESTILRKWFQNEWLLAAKKWVLGYHPPNIFFFQHLSVSIVECLQSYEEVLNHFDGKRETILNSFEKLTLVMEKEYYTYEQRNNDLKKYCNGFLFKHGISITNQLPECMVPLLYKQNKKVMEKCNVVITEEEESGVFIVTCTPSDRNHICEKETKTDKARAIENTKPLIENLVTETEQTVLTGCDSIAQLVKERLEAHKTRSALANKNCPNEEFAAGIFRGQPILKVQEVANVVETGLFKVGFGDSENLCFCSCTFWQMFKIPCLHMIAIFNNIPEWQYDMISPMYRYSNIFTYDSSSSKHKLLWQKSSFSHKETQTERDRTIILQDLTAESNKFKSAVVSPIRRITVKDSNNSQDGKITNYKIVMSQEAKKPLHNLTISEKNKKVKPEK